MRKMANYLRIAGRILSGLCVIKQMVPPQWAILAGMGWPGK
jgi:hypothetical protein